MRCEWKAAAGAERDVRPHKRFLRKHTRTHTHIRTHLHTHTHAHINAQLFAYVMETRWQHRRRRHCSLVRSKIASCSLAQKCPLATTLLSLTLSLSLSFLSLFIRLSSGVPHSSPAQPPALLHSHSHSRPEETSQNLMGICRLTGSYTVRKIKRCHQLLDLIVKD